MGKKVKVDKKAQRIKAVLNDAIKISKSRSKNANGFLICSDALLAKEGVMTYNDWELPGELLQVLDYPAKVRIYRSLDTLATHMEDYQQLPMTDGHPFESVTIKDRTGIMGIVNDAKINGKGIRGKITIFDIGMVSDIELGEKTELSLGYDTDLVVQAGEYEGEQYDVVQTDVLPNHVALTKTGRCGPDCKIGDSIMACDCLACSNKAANRTKTKTQTKGKRKMSDETINVVIGDEVVEVVAKDAAIVKDTAVKLRDAIKKNDQLQGEIDTLKAEETRLKDEYSEDKIAERVNVAAKIRGSILSKASTYVTDSLDGKTNREAMEAAVKAHDSKRDFNDKSDDYVQSAFDSLPEKVASKDKGNGQAFAGTHNDSDVEDAAVVARTKLMNRNARRESATK